MGVRAYVVTKYVCEYGESPDFNYEAVRVWRMLAENGVYLRSGCGCGCDCYYGHWTIHNSKELQAYIAKLGTLPPDEVNEYFDADDESHQDYTNQSVKETLEEWVLHCDKKSGFIRVHWR